MVIVFRENAAMSLYFDGALEDKAPAQVIYGNPEPFQIGGLFGQSLFTGRVDEVAVWRRTLSRTEILALYNDGDGTSLTPTLADAEHD